MLIDPFTLMTFGAAALILNLTPGPDMLFVAASGIARGTRAGLAAAGGVFAGTLVHTAFAAAGVSAAIAASPLAFDILRYGGAAYLIWLGVNAILRPQPPPELTAAAARPAALGRAFRDGFVTNVLNPKVGIFFLAFLPQFVDAERGAVAAQVAVLGMIVNIGGAVVNGAVAITTARLAGWLARRPGIARLQSRVAGAMFVALGLRLVVGERAPA